MISAGCCVLLLISWIIAVNITPVAEKQLTLINSASALIEDGIYIRAFVGICFYFLNINIKNP